MREPEELTHEQRLTADFIVAILKGSNPTHMGVLEMHGEARKLAQAVLRG